MKKQDVAGIIVYVIILALAAVFGLVVIREYSPKSGLSSGIFILFVAGAILSGILFNAILFELAHMVGAKIGGYNITFVSILGFTFEKVDGKFKFHLSSYDGLTGETRIIPNLKRKKPANPMPYLLFGTVFYAIEVVVFVMLFALLRREELPTSTNNIAYFLLTMMAVGGMILFYNIIPLRLDSLTDGYKMRLVSGKKNKEAFNAMLLGETANTENQEQQEEGQSSFSNDLKVNQLYVCLDEEKYPEAEKIVDEIIEDAKTNKKISNKALIESKANKIYLMFMNKDFEEAKKYCDESLSLHDKKALSEESNLAALRAYVLVSGLVDRSRSECVRSLDKVYKIYKHTPEERRQLESKLFNKAIDLVHEKHPDWGIADYRINA